MIVVTGSTGDIGRAICKEFGDCFGIDKHNCDLTNSREVRSIVGTLGHVDVLVNCAGVSLQGEYGDMDVWDRTFAVNVRAVYYLSSLVKNLMTDGSIINITSMNAEMATPMNPAYIASKGALKMLTKAMAYDWAPIRVNNVCPGYVHTNMTHKSWSDPEQRRTREARTILGRYAEPQEIAHVVKFLTTATYITGADIVVDGGWLIRGI